MPKIQQKLCKNDRINLLNYTITINFFKNLTCQFKSIGSLYIYNQYQNNKRKMKRKTDDFSNDIT